MTDFEEVPCPHCSGKGKISFGSIVQTKAVEIISFESNSNLNAITFKLPITMKVISMVLKGPTKFDNLEIFTDKKTKILHSRFDLMQMNHRAFKPDDSFDEYYIPVTLVVSNEKQPSMTDLICQWSIRYSFIFC